MTWQLYAASAIVMYTTLNLVQRIIAVDSKNQRAMAVLFNFIAGLISISIFFITQAHKNFVLPTDYKAYIALGIATFFYAMFERGRFQAAKHLEASVLTTIFNISLVVAFVGSVILYSETITFSKLVGSLLVLTALFISSYNKTSVKISKYGVTIAILISVMLGLGSMLDKMGAQYFNSATYSILVWTIPIIFIFFPYVKFKDIKEEYKASSWKIWLLAFINVLAYMLQLKALEIAEATKVLTVVQTSTLFTILLATLILKERDRIAIKVLAGVLAILGTILLIK